MPRKSKASTDREKWNKIFNGLVQLLNTQQSQLEYLLSERKLLENRIKLQYDRWVSDVRLLEDQISEMRGEVTMQEMFRSLDSAKADLAMSLKERESSVFQLKLDYAESELVDLRAGFDCLCKEDKSMEGCPNTYKRKGGRDGKMKDVAHDRKDKGVTELEDEVKRLKLDYEKLAFEKSSEISALLAEKDFVWNQYNLLESSCNSKLKSKGDELEQANKKITTLLAHMEQLESQNKDKDETITTLQKRMQDDSAKLKEEISRLTQELDSLERSQSASLTPVPKRCTTRASSSRSSKAFDTVKESQKGGRSLKQKRDAVIPISRTSALFTSSFKVPKLKSSTSGSKVTVNSVT